MKSIFLACTVEQNGKYISFVDVWQCHNNLKCLFDAHPDLVTAHICESRKQADEIVLSWNAAYKSNGTYLYA